MPVSQTKLRKPKKIFTKQDFIDGKCTADGTPTGEANGADPEPTPSINIVSDPGTQGAETSTTIENLEVTDTVSSEATFTPDDVDETPTTEIDNGDTIDGEESEDDTDRGSGSGEEVDKETT